jgi:hypothetical protein
LELAKEGAITACKKYNPGHICKIVDPPEDPPYPPPPGPTPASNPNKPDSQDTTTSMEARPNEEVLRDAGK